MKYKNNVIKIDLKQAGN